MQEKKLIINKLMLCIFLERYVNKGVNY